MLKLYELVKKNLFYVLLTFVLFYLVGCEQTKKFEVSNEVDFYVISEKNIIGFCVEDGLPKEITKTNIDVIETSINPVVHRAELSNRYLVFTEDDWPKGNKEALVSVDFKDGIIRHRKTEHIAYTAAGSTFTHYFASTSGGISFISVINPELEEVDYLELEIPMIIDDFLVTDENMYAFATDVKSTLDINGIPSFKNRLIKITEANGSFAIDSIKKIEDNPNKQYWFGDIISKGNYLYATSQGYRELKTLKKVMNGSVYRYDLQNEIGEFFPVEKIAPRDIYDIGDDLLAISHSMSYLDSAGFTLFEYSTCESQFIEYTQIDSEEMIMDIKRLDQNTLLILTNKQLLGYDLLLGDTIFNLICDTTAGNPFHLWVCN